MALYVAPLTEGNESIQALKEVGLSSLFYKSFKGPLGFCIDDESTHILYEIVKDTTWYSVIEDKFYLVDDSIFEKYKYNFRGVFFLEKEEFKAQIDQAMAIIKAKEKNKILKRYNMPLLDISENIIIESFKNNSYQVQNIKEMLFNKNVLLWNWSEFGGQLIFHKFDNCLLLKRIPQNKTLSYKNNINEIESW